MAKFRWQVAGDVSNNTLSLEFWDEEGQPIADITRHDDVKQLKLNTFNHDVDVSVLEQMIALAEEKLGCFEDGTLLGAARVTDELLF